MPKMTDEEYDLYVLQVEAQEENEDNFIPMPGEDAPQTYHEAENLSLTYYEIQHYDYFGY